MNTLFQPVRVLACLLILLACAGRAQAADEAERFVFTFQNEANAWHGTGPFKFGGWPVRDGALRLPIVEGKLVEVTKIELMVPAQQVNVLQLQADFGSASKAQIWFTTGLSPKPSPQKMVEFDLRPGSGAQEYNLDFKGVSSWKDQVASLRIRILGAKAGEELSITRIVLLEGDKISKPLVYAPFKLGEKHVVPEFRAGSLFGDKMVLQRGKPVPVFGHAQPGEQVTVAFAGQRLQTAADAQGRWEVQLAPLTLSDQPGVMTLTGQKPGHKLEFTDILVGDVWLCGGQSNMGGSPRDNLPTTPEGKSALEKDYPQFRTVAIPTLNRDTPLDPAAIEEPLRWNSTQASMLNSFSAVSYYFGHAIHVHAKIPVGLVFTIKAGSQVEQWLDAETLKNIYTDEELKACCGGSHLASGLYNGMVAPVRKFPLRGGMWYQGESNADNEARYMGYYKSLPAMIRSWRATWGADLPVMLVQLPAFEGRYPPESWAYVREVELLCATQLPNVGIAVSFDEGDITNLHPSNKYFIGTRLGLQARARVYGEAIECFGPMYAGVEKLGNKLAVKFDHVAGGLQARGELTGFEIRGGDGRWISANAAINGKDRVIVESPEVPQPEAVRYAWANAPKATLFNDLHLPASPFRSDTPEKLVQTVRFNGAAAPSGATLNGGR